VNTNPTPTSRGIVSGAKFNEVLSASEMNHARGLGSRTTRGFFPRKADSRASSGDTIPRGTVVMVHLFPTEVIGDFFDSGTGVGLGRWLGWALCDGLNDGPNMQGFFPVCADPDNDDYDVQGNGENTNEQIGYKWHGQTENNHQDHALNHSHADLIDVDPFPELCAAAGTDVYAFPASPTFTQSSCIASWLTAGSLPDYYPPEINDNGGSMAEHYGPFNSNNDTDNRPPNYVIHFAVKL